MIIVHGFWSIVPIISSLHWHFLCLQNSNLRKFFDTVSDGVVVKFIFQVDKLKDLCLKQREEIKSLKSAILFPDVMNSQLQELLEKQGSELKQANQLIPSLQRQVTSLTGQLQFLAEDLAEVIIFIISF